MRGCGIVRILVLILALLLLLEGCSNNVLVIKGRTVEEVINKTDRIPLPSILHKEEVNNGILVFYIPEISGENEIESMLGIEFLEKKLTGYEMSYKGGSYFNGANKRVYHELFYINENIPGLYGEIRDSAIIKLVIDQEQSTKKATIFHIQQKPFMNSDMTFWYTLLDSIEPPILIKGYDVNGDEVFSAEYLHSSGSEGTTKVEGH